MSSSSSDLLPRWGADLALAVASAWADQHGHAVPVPVRLGSNALFCSQGLAVRVAPPGEQGSSRLVALAEMLAGLGAPVVVPAGPVECYHGCEVSCWEWVDQSAPLDMRALGAATRRFAELDLAAVSAAVSLEGLAVAQLSKIVQRLDVVERAELSWVSADDLRLLWDVALEIQRVVPLMAGLPNVLLHGDLHPDNALMSPTGVLLTDLERVCVGPAAWDHMGVLAQVERFGRPMDDYEDFVEGYGQDMRGRPETPWLLRLRLLSATTWSLVAGQHREDLGREAAARLAFWRGDVTSPAWLAL